MDERLITFMSMAVMLFSRNISSGERARPSSNRRSQTLPSSRPGQHIGSYGSRRQLHKWVLPGLIFCLRSLIWQPCWQAQACGALAEWLRHQPEYTNLAPNAIENFNLASSFMSKVNMDILLEWELQNIKGAPREDDQCVHSCRQAKSRRGGWSRCPGFN